MITELKRLTKGKVAVFIDAANLELSAKDKMGFAASRYVEKIWFTRDLFMMAAMGQCPFRKNPRRH